jgi:hypothetical protein
MEPRLIILPPSIVLPVCAVEGRALHVIETKNTKCGTGFPLSYSIQTRIPFKRSVRSVRGLLVYIGPGLVRWSGGSGVKSARRRG